MKGLKAFKGGLIVSTSERNLFFNASTFMLERLNTRSHYELPSGIECPFDTNSQEYVSSAGSLILTPDFALYELQLPYVLKDQKVPFNYETLRGPILATAFGLVIVYQLFFKQNAFFKSSTPPEGLGSGAEMDMSQLTSSLKNSMLKKGQKMTPKMKNDLSEIDKMLANVSNLGNNLNNATKKRN